MSPTVVCRRCRQTIRAGEWVLVTETHRPATLIGADGQAHRFDSADIAIHHDKPCQYPRFPTVADSHPKPGAVRPQDDPGVAR